MDIITAADRHHTVTAHVFPAIHSDGWTFAIALDDGDEVIADCYPDRATAHERARLLAGLALTGRTIIERPCPLVA